MPLVTTALVVGGAAYTFYKVRQRVRRAEQATAARPAKPAQPVEEAPDTVGAADDDGRVAIADRDLKIGAASIGLAVGGAVVSPVLAPLSAVPALYITVPIWRDAYASVVEDREIRASVVDALAIAIAGVTFSFTALALGAFLHTGCRKLLLQTEDRSRSRLVDVFAHGTMQAWCLVDGAEVEVPIERVARGDLVVIHAGNTIPIDGVVHSGVASVDQRVLTGEASPAEKGPGDPVFSSTLVLSGRLVVLVERTGADTVVSRIAEILNDTDAYKALMRSRGERAANAAAAPFLALSALALPVVGLVGAGAVMCASFGYHLRVLGPIGMLNSLSTAASSGILVRDGRSLETLADVDLVVFDKTGTLTQEQQYIARIVALGEFDEDDVLRLAATAEVAQSHPIARAILEAAEARGLQFGRGDDVRYEIGYGLVARSEGRSIQVGSARFMTLSDVALPDSDTLGPAAGHSRVFVAVDGVLAGYIDLDVTVRPEAVEVVRRLRGMDIDVAIISGDHRSPTRRLAERLGIERYHAETLPADKANLIEAFRADGRTVCFVGDGINDAIALKRADASISVCGATTAATDSAQVVLLNPDLRLVCEIIELARRFDRNQKVSFAVTMAPSILGVYGAFFLHFGLVAPIVLNNTGLVVGVANTMLPALRSKPDRPHAPVDRRTQDGIRRSDAEEPSPKRR